MAAAFSVDLRVKQFFLPKNKAMIHNALHFAAIRGL